MKSTGRRVTVLAAVLALGAVSGIGSSAAGTPAAGPEGQGGEGGPVSNLFVLTADEGALEPADEPDQFSLVLERVPKRITVFSDRPARLDREQSTRSFAADWAANGFVDDPPNAALVIDEAPASRDVGVFELSNPSYDADARTLRFDARQIGQPSARLRRYALEADPELREKFGRASLFIDSAPGTYALLAWMLEGAARPTITISNAKWTFSNVQPLPNCGSPPNNLVLPTAVSETSFTATSQDTGPNSGGCAWWGIYLCSSTQNTTTLEGTASGLGTNVGAFNIDDTGTVQSDGPFSIPLNGDIYQSDC